MSLRSSPSSPFLSLPPLSLVGSVRFLKALPWSALLRRRYSCPWLNIRSFWRKGRTSGRSEGETKGLLRIQGDTSNEGNQALFVCRSKVRTAIKLSNHFRSFIDRISALIVFQISFIYLTPCLIALFRFGYRFLSGGALGLNILLFFIISLWILLYFII